MNPELIILQMTVLPIELVWKIEVKETLCGRSDRFVNSCLILHFKSQKLPDRRHRNITEFWLFLKKIVLNCSVSPTVAFDSHNETTVRKRYACIKGIFR